MAKKDVTPEQVVEDRVSAATRSWKNLTEENLRRNAEAVITAAGRAARAALSDCDLVVVDDVRVSCTPKGVVRVAVSAHPPVATVVVQLLLNKV